MNSNKTIIKYISEVFESTCGSSNPDWLKRVWCLLSTAPEKLILPHTMGISDICDTVPIYNNITEDDYVAIAYHAPADMNMFITNCILKLREAIITENLNYMEQWTIQLKPDSAEESNVLAYFLSFLYYVFTIDEGDDGRIVRAFMLLTMLVRYWRKTLPSACIAVPFDIDEPLAALTIYQGESTLPEGYQAVENLFLYAIDMIEQKTTYVQLLTNDILYDITVIVQMPVSFSLGLHVARLCSVIAIQSKMTIGNDFDSCDVKSRRIDLAFSWIYHLLLNTPPNLHETVCDNVGAACSSFVNLFDDDEKLSDVQNTLNRENVIKFFTKIKERIMYSHWFKRVFSTLAQHYGSRKEFSKLLLQFPHSISWGVIKTMINNNDQDVQITQVCGNYLIGLNAQSIHSNSQAERDEITLLKSQLLYFSFYPFAKIKIDPDNLPIYLKVMYDLALQPEQRFYKDMINFTYNDPIVTPLMRVPLNVAYMISSHMSMSWRHVSANQLIINFWCVFVKLSNELGPRHFKTVAVLIETSTASDLHLCVNRLADIIPYIVRGELDEVVITRIINTLLRHALDPGSMSHDYARALFKVMFTHGIMLAATQHIGYRVAYCICNNNTSIRLFQKFRELRLLTDEIVASIVNTFVTHNQPIAWNIMHRTLQCVEYPDIPQYMFNLLRSFVQMEVLCSSFSADTQLAFFGSVLSIVRCRRARHLIGAGDTEFFNLLSTYLRKCFDTSHSTSQVQFLYLDLVSELRTFMPALEEWIRRHFQKCHFSISQSVSDADSYGMSATRLALFREIAKTFGDMAIRLKLTAREEVVELIAIRIKDHTTIRAVPPHLMGRYSMHWSTLALLLGKICVQKAEYVAIYIDAMNHVLRNGSESQKSMIVEAMSDICRIHIENIGIIMPYLMEYLARRSYLQVSACESLLNLLNSGNVRLKRTEYLLLVSLISSEESTLRGVFMKLFEENLLPNNSDLILSNFIPMMLYFHKVFNHPDYIFDSDEREKINNIPGMIENRLSTYTILIKYVKTNEKFHLMVKVATDIISVLHHRRLPHSQESVKLLTDAYTVIYAVTQTIDNKYDVPHGANQMYTDTFQKMLSMEKRPAYLFMNYDTQIKELLVILLAMLEDIHTVHPSMFQDTFHLIMFMIATFFANVSSLVVSLQATSFPGSVKSLPVLYERYKESFGTYAAEIYKL